MSYLNPPLSPYSGALVVQFDLCPFYIFVALSLMVLYQLESLHLDDYNLIYSQKKNRGFDSISFGNQTFLFLQSLLQTNPNQYQPTIFFKTQPNTTPKAKLLLSTFGVFPNSNTNKRGLGFESYLKSLSNFNTKVPPCFLSL